MESQYSSCWRSVIGGVLAAVTLLCFVAGAITVQALDKLLPVFELNFIRITSKVYKMHCIKDYSI